MEKIDDKTLTETMSIIIEKNREYIKQLRKAKVAFDNFNKVMAKYMAKNKYKILKELFEEHNKIMKGK